MAIRNRSRGPRSSAPGSRHVFIMGLRRPGHITQKAEMPVVLPSANWQRAAHVRWVFAARDSRKRDQHARLAASHSGTSLIPEPIRYRSLALPAPEQTVFLLLVRGIHRERQGWRGRRSGNDDGTGRGALWPGRSRGSDGSSPVRDIPRSAP